MITNIFNFTSEAEYFSKYFDTKKFEITMISLLVEILVQILIFMYRIIKNILLQNIKLKIHLCHLKKKIEYKNEKIITINNV